MNLSFYNSKKIENYTSESQKIRLLTEPWVKQTIFCPNCGKTIEQHKNNNPVADFFCPNCNEDFELKSKKNTIGKKITDGAYTTMIERLKSETNPNLFLLTYKNYSVENFLVVPKSFFIPTLIEERPPLAETAKRAGWIGCNILIAGIPDAGKIFFIKNKQFETKENVLSNFKKIAFLKQTEDSNKIWLIEIMKCIELLKKEEFTLTELYAFEKRLKTIYPNNNHIQEKIRQQLQFLRNSNYIEFLGNGRYKRRK